MSEILVAEELARHYSVGQGTFRAKATLRAVDGVGFSLQPGKTLAVSANPDRENPPSGA